MPLVGLRLASRSDSDVYDYLKTTEDSMPVMMLVSVLPWVARLIHTDLFKSLLANERASLALEI